MDILLTLRVGINPEIAVYSMQLHIYFGIISPLRIIRRARRQCSQSSWKGAHCGGGRCALWTPTWGLVASIEGGSVP